MLIQSDAMESFLKEIAIMAGNYKSALIKNGFTEEQAMELVINWQHNVMNTGGEKEE